MVRHTSVDENVSFQVVATPEGSITMIADEVLLHFGQWTIPILVHHHHLSTQGHKRTISRIQNTQILLNKHSTINTNKVNEIHWSVNITDPVSVVVQNPVSQT